MKKPEMSKLQVARFLETARALGCDEDEAAFDEKLRGIAGQGCERKLAEKKQSPKPQKIQRS